MDYENITKVIRKDIFLAALSANNAHLASAFSIVETMYVLYEQGVLRVDPKNPRDEGRDWFILSKGHGSLALYCELYRRGFFDRDTFLGFSKPGSSLGGEPCFPDTPGVECSTGSLGHGLGFAAGAAFAKKLDGRSEKVYCLVGDGECQEGSTWEALMFASRQGLDNLTVLVDCNGLQKMNRVDAIAGVRSYEPYFQVFGCETMEVDGHNIHAIQACLTAENCSGKPRAVLLRTVKGKGVSIMENNPGWHWRLPKKKELKVFMQELGISEEEVEYAKSVRNGTV
ncbi:MAG: transketolase [Oscillospiraceae bacterium]|nr:transketolase [Oscillospiraceae bacterium]